MRHERNVIITIYSGNLFNEIDFFDVKALLTNILGHGHFALTFKPHAPYALHPGQSAEIWLNNKLVGCLGALHPRILQALKLTQPVLLFELYLNLIQVDGVKKSSSLSKFPEIRRDIAIVVSDAIPFELIQDTIRNVGGELLKEIDIFDLYQGKGITEGHRSIALSLSLQHATRTLIDEEVTNLVAKIVTELKGRFNAELRG